MGKDRRRSRTRFEDRSSRLNRADGFLVAGFPRSRGARVCLNDAHGEY
jgi:hypothetical protein